MVAKGKTQARRRSTRTSSASSNSSSNSRSSSTSDGSDTSATSISSSSVSSVLASSVSSVASGSKPAAGRVEPASADGPRRSKRRKVVNGSESDADTSGVDELDGNEALDEAIIQADTDEHPVLPDASVLDEILRATIAKHDRATDLKAAYDGNRSRARLSREVPHPLSTIQERWEAELLDLCGTLPDHYPEISAFCRYFFDLLEGDTNEHNWKPKGEIGETFYHAENHAYTIEMGRLLGLDDESTSSYNCMPFVYSVKETSKNPFEKYEHDLVKALVILGHQHERKVKIELGTVTMTFGSGLRLWASTPIEEKYKSLLRPRLLRIYGEQYARLEHIGLEEIVLHVEAPITPTCKTAGAIKFAKFKHMSWAEASAFLETESTCAFIWADLDRAAKSGLAITLYHLLTGNRRVKAAPDASFLLQARSVRGGLAQICKNMHWGSQSEPIRDISWYQMADPLAYGHLVHNIMKLENRDLLHQFLPAVTDNSTLYEVIELAKAAGTSLPRLLVRIYVEKARATRKLNPEKATLTRQARAAGTLPEWKRKLLDRKSEQKRKAYAQLKADAEGGDADALARRTAMLDKERDRQRKASAERKAAAEGGDAGGPLFDEKRSFIARGYHSGETAHQAALIPIREKQAEIQQLQDRLKELMGMSSEDREATGEDPMDILARLSKLRES